MKVGRSEVGAQAAGSHTASLAGEDAIYGLDIPLMKLVNIFKSAAQRYGTERRVILLHGPVGSSKSTIARLLKKGLEAYSKTHAGALYTFGWARDLDKPEEVVPCPMHEEPLHLVPVDLQDKRLAVGEVAVERALSDACLLGDRAQRDIRRERQLRERHFEDSLAVALGVRALRRAQLFAHSSSFRKT